jgi:hypothetical protein
MTRLSARVPHGERPLDSEQGTNSPPLRSHCVLRGGDPRWPLNRPGRNEANEGTLNFEKTSGEKK